MSKILVFGDFTTEERGKDAVLKGYAVDDRITELIKSSDYSLVNMEAPIADEKDKPIEKFGPNLKTIPETVTYLSSLGIKGVTLANNHFFDYGISGVEKTLGALEKAGLDYVGGGRTEFERKKILYISLPDCQVAILNYCEHEFSVHDKVGSNPISPISFYYDIQETKQHADVVLTIVHGGHEGYQLPSPRMQELYRFMIDCGSNIVINHHQHCYSGFEQYHNGYIYYGLGNFFFDSMTENDRLWEEGYFLSIAIDNKQVVDIQILPYVQCEMQKAHVRLMTDSESSSFIKSLERINRIIADRGALNKYFCEFCDSKRNNYIVPLYPYSNRYLCALAKRNILPSFVTNRRKRMLLNYVQCEAHRDVLEKSLRQK